MIQMRSTPAKIGLSSINAQLTIKQSKAEVKIEQPPAKLDISVSPSFLSIDQSKAFHDMDLKSVLVRTKENADQGYQDWLEGLARMAQQGDELMRIELKENPIPLQALENTSGPVFEFNYGTVPSNHFRVELNYTPSVMEINWEQQNPIIKITPRLPEYSYQHGGVDVYLLQRNSLTISYVRHKIDQIG